MNLFADKSGPPTAKQTASLACSKSFAGATSAAPLHSNRGETVVGNALNGQAGLDLREQEGDSPRRMAARHAAFECSGQDLSIRDLESPGGTFVNQQRLLSGQPRKLSPGDVIQLGGVQLKVQETAAAHRAAAAAGSRGDHGSGIGRAGAAPAHRPVAPNKAAQPQATPSAAPPDATLAGRPQRSRASLPAATDSLRSRQQAAGSRPPSRWPSGAQCRTWDDFLDSLGPELERRFATSWSRAGSPSILRRIGRPDLIPHSAADRSPDDRLDEWLARMPATQSSAPELDVHPASAAGAGEDGGRRHPAVAADHQCRLPAVAQLRCGSSPPTRGGSSCSPGKTARPFQTIDQTEIPVELELPETIDRMLARADRDREQRRHAPGRGSGRAAGRPAAGGRARRWRRGLRASDPRKRAARAAGEGQSARLARRSAVARRSDFGCSSRLRMPCPWAAPARVSLSLGSARSRSSRWQSACCRRFAAGQAARRAARPIHGRNGRRTAGPACPRPCGIRFCKVRERLLGSWSTSLAAVCLFWAVLAAVRCSDLDDLRPSPPGRSAG